ncbi:hypothetical protein GCM10009789_64300 [Kribbella sancticallisti]|uniref:Uncharacterized protein n=1 Tax=Kribbella sancticallisti TaxID=460087 RepID=A0ABP4Q8S1_9ACTN
MENRRRVCNGHAFILELHRGRDTNPKHRWSDRRPYFWPVPSPLRLGAHEGAALERVSGIIPWHRCRSDP